MQEYNQDGEFETEMAGPNEELSQEEEEEEEFPAGQQEQTQEEQIQARIARIIIFNSVSI